LAWIDAATAGMLDRADKDASFLMAADRADADGGGLRRLVGDPLAAHALKQENCGGRENR
jgi:hypothetical protein